MWGRMEKMYSSSSAFFSRREHRTLRRTFKITTVTSREREEESFVYFHFFWLPFILAFTSSSFSHFLYVCFRLPNVSSTSSSSSSSACNERVEEKMKETWEMLLHLLFVSLFVSGWRTVTERLLVQHDFRFPCETFSLNPRTRELPCVSSKFLSGHDMP